MTECDMINHEQIAKSNDGKSGFRKIVLFAVEMRKNKDTEYLYSLIYIRIHTRIRNIHVTEIVLQITVPQGEFS